MFLVSLPSSQSRSRPPSRALTLVLVMGLAIASAGSVSTAWASSDATAAWASLALGMSFAWVLVLRTLSVQRRSLASRLVALQTANRELRAANRELEAFAGRAAHDMRNVLSPIELGVRSLRTDLADANTRDASARILRAVSRGRNLVDGLLAFSRAGGIPPIHPATTRIAVELHDVLDELDEAAAACGASVALAVSPSASVAIAPALLHVILSNVIGNALKYMHASARRELSIEAHEIEDGCAIVVTDTGPGIPESEHARVFDPLYRGEDAIGDGIGLGLATVRRIVEAHSGCIQLRSAVGEGTTIEIRLPPAPAHRLREPSGASDEALPAYS